VEAGLTATLLEAPDHLQGQLTIPPDHLRVCQLDNIATVGNAAGNSVNWLNLTGQPTVAPEYDDGYVFLYHLRTSEDLETAMLTADGRSGPWLVPRQNSGPGRELKGDFIGFEMNQSAALPQV